MTGCPFCHRLNGADDDAYARAAVRDYLKSRGLAIAKSSSPFLVRAVGSPNDFTGRTSLDEWVKIASDNAPAVRGFDLATGIGTPKMNRIITAAF